MLIEKGRRKEALFSLLTPPNLPPSPSWTRVLPSVTGLNRFKSFLRRRSAREWQAEASALLADSKATACNVLELYFSRNKSKMVRDYFAFRFGHARHLVGLSFAATLANRPDKAVLDLACGCGRVTSGLVQQAEGAPVIGADQSFFGLYVANGWTAPEANYVCCAGDISLPFISGTFSAVFCSDAFQLFLSKATSVQEFKRLTQHRGTIVLFSVRNWLPGTPLFGMGAASGRVSGFVRRHAPSPGRGFPSVGSISSKAGSSIETLCRYRASGRRACAVDRRITSPGRIRRLWKLRPLAARSRALGPEPSLRQSQHEWTRNDFLAP